jgi:cupin fold WbuC family metalloprotein
MQVRGITDEVYIADEPIVKVTRRDVEWLKGLAAGTRRRRVRLCAHRSTRDGLHEMVIVLNGATYVRPHRHRGKSESFHVIEGTLTVLLFDDDGRVLETIPMGEYGSGRPFFYRLAGPVYHTILIESASAVIHETTNGPFDRGQTEFAPWAPAEEDEDAARHYQRELGSTLRTEIGAD